MGKLNQRRSMKLPVDILTERLASSRTYRLNDHFGLTEAEEDTEMEYEDSYLLASTNGTSGNEFSMPPTPHAYN